MTSNTNRNSSGRGRSNSKSSGKRNTSSSRSSSSNTRRNTSSRGNTSTSRNTRNTNSRTNTRTNSRTNNRRTPSNQQNNESEYINILAIVGLFALFILMFLFALGLFTNKVPMFITNVIRGLFGFNAYVIPVLGIVFLVYYTIEGFTKKYFYKLISLIMLLVSIGLIAHFIAFEKISNFKFTEAFGLLYHKGTGGGIFIGSVAYFIEQILGKPFILIFGLILLIAALAVLIGKKVYALTTLIIDKIMNLEDSEEDDDDEDEDARYKKKEIGKMRQQINQEEKKKKPSFTIKQDDEPEETKPEKASIIDVSPLEIRSIKEDEIKELENSNKELIEEPVKEVKETNDIHAVKLPDEVLNTDEITPINVYDEIVPIVSEVVTNPVVTTVSAETTDDFDEKYVIEDITEEPAITLTENAKAMLSVQNNYNDIVEEKPLQKDVDVYKPKEEVKKAVAYKFPPVSLLKKGTNKTEGKNNIADTAMKLQTTLATFGVEVTVDPRNCSRGPAVTRYELTPAPGVKVSRIVSLSDDIKLSLGAQDIRIEAPIPGKSAVGIEVPNEESTAVPFRDLVESNDFSDAKSKITFTVGKDLSGQIVLADIAKMPHLLIAGSTGSGKSVCINSIIMSILYKAHPDDVKLILIDPKVVELSVYNGIPHLLWKVVTDPKQASAALHWGVSEMEDRYKKFADAGVRDLKGYNEYVMSHDDLKKMPQIVIIVDELADLMMVAGKEVEESICRLAQLARAAGIHLIIATQRPSVDVITGLIKANMPSRIAFAVSSGVDSRTILDSNGAEKLLGKGDMLFFPQGVNKPSRVQGCFVSDNEVHDVVDFIKNQNISDYGNRNIEEVITGSAVTCAVPGGDMDDLFVQAATFIIGKEKASIGALQRAFKIGFNRAARIMDQLEAKGVVGPEEGTKPRKILMTQEQFNEMMSK